MSMKFIEMIVIEMCPRPPLLPHQCQISIDDMIFMQAKNVHVYLHFVLFIMFHLN